MWILAEIQIVVLLESIEKLDSAPRDLLENRLGFTGRCNSCAHSNAMLLIVYLKSTFVATAVMNRINAADEEGREAKKTNEMKSLGTAFSLALLIYGRRVT